MNKQAPETTVKAVVVSLVTSIRCCFHKRRFLTFSFFTDYDIILNYTCKTFSSYLYLEMGFLAFTHFLKGSKFKLVIVVRAQATAL